MGLRYGYTPGDLPVTERVSGQLVRLPFYTSMTNEEQRLVIDTIAQLDPQVFESTHG